MLFSSHTDSKIHVLLRIEPFNLQVFWNFPALFSLLISSLISLWSENRLYMISDVLNLLECVLWPRMWSFLVYASCELETTCILLLDEAVCRCLLYPFVDGVVEFSYVCTDFLPDGFVHL